MATVSRPKPTRSVCALKASAIRFSDDRILCNPAILQTISPAPLTAADGYQRMKAHANRWNGKTTKVMEDGEQKTDDARKQDSRDSYGKTRTQTETAARQQCNDAYRLCERSVYHRMVCCAIATAHNQCLAFRSWVLTTTR